MVDNRGEAGMGNLSFEKRELYAPGHFGNSYEVAGRYEMREILSESKWWGFNWYGDWFDTVNLTKQSYLPDIVSQCWLSRVMWENKKRNFREAQNLGFSLNLNITPNHVFADQCAEELQVPVSSRTYGHLICPSIPEARNVILGNYEEWFKDLFENNIHIHALTAGPYDFGGCSCKKCEPWIVTFAQLSKELHERASEYFPGIEMHFLGWFCEQEEHNQFAEWLDSYAPGWLKGESLWIAYNETKSHSVPPGKLPRGCEGNYFVHIGYADVVGEKGRRDQYGEWGPTIAPKRIPQTLENLKSAGGKGFTAYSEGIFDDVNKCLLAGIGSGKFSSSEEVLEAYAERYFNADLQARKEWADWLVQWGTPFEVDVKTARRVFDRLSSTAPQTWRFQQLSSKLRLFELNREIERHENWSDGLSDKAEAFFREKERLSRQIYGLSPLSEPVFGTIAGLPEWYKKWQGHISIIGKSHSAEA